MMGTTKSPMNLRMSASTSANKPNVSPRPTAVITPARFASSCSTIRRMTRAKNTSNGSITTIPIKPRTRRNRNKLLAAPANLRHGTSTSAWSKATQ